MNFHRFLSITPMKILMLSYILLMNTHFKMRLKTLLAPPMMILPLLMISTTVIVLLCIKMSLINHPVFSAVIRIFSILISSRPL